MNKAEFLNELSRKLRYLPIEDREDAISYYVEYLDDCDFSDTDDVTKTVGLPKDVAREILANVKEKHANIPDEEKSVKDKATVTWLVILGLCSLPITAPLGIAAIAVVFSLLLCYFIILFSFELVAFCLVLVGLVAFYGVIVAPGFGTKLMCFGCAFGSIALGILIGIGTKNLLKASFGIFRKRK